MYCSHSCAGDSANSIIKTKEKEVTTSLSIVRNSDINRRKNKRERSITFIAMGPDYNVVD